MDQVSHVRFFARALLNANLYFLLQLPSKFHIQLDRNKFLQSISTLVDDDRVSTGDWPLGPGFAPLNKSPSAAPTTAIIDSVAQDTSRAEAIAKWDTYFTKTATHIPYAVVNKKTTTVAFDADVPSTVDGEHNTVNSKGKKKAVSTNADCPTCGKAKPKNTKARNMTGPRPKQNIRKFSGCSICSF